VLAASLGVLASALSKVRPGKKVAIVSIQGAILSSQEVVEELRGYAKDPSVKAIVLRINSPGGPVAPAQEIYQEVKRASEKKPVVVSMGSIAASGGYYIASAATRIVANPGTITGSIGVIMEIPNIQGLMKKLGIKTVVIKSGRHKDMASAFREMSPEQRRILEELLADVHEQFVQAVAEGRGMELQQVKALADGRVFTGRQAKALGLVDALGNLQEAIQLAKELAGIEGEPTIIRKKRRPSLWRLLGDRARFLTEPMWEGIRIKYIYAP
jgi:protease-4